jgi:phosphoribosylaminoimidazole-succinocarboxamide synthase
VRKGLCGYGHSPALGGRVDLPVQARTGHAQTMFSAPPSAQKPGGTAQENRMTRRRQIYEGKAKILYEGPEPGTIIQYFKDDATAFNAQKKGTISGKGVLNNRISEHVFTMLGMIGIPTHFIRRLNMREQLVRQVEIIPIEVVVRNVAAGSIAKRFGIEEGTQLPRTIIEYYYKDDSLNDPLVSDEHIAAFGWASQDEMHDIADMAIRVNDFMAGMFAGVGIRLVDFKLEFGRLFDGDFARVILADEISPDNCRLWDMKTGDKMDKDRFRRDLGGEVEAYQEVARRLGLLTEDESAVLDLDEHRKARGQAGGAKAGGPIMVPTEAPPVTMVPDPTPPST